jgi:FlaG/FlaF family flagellin (archaellin)
MVAVVVVLAAVVGTVALDLQSEMDETAPAVAQSSGELVADVDGSDDQTVRLTHLGGDELVASELEIVVDARAACGKSGRLVNLPAGGGDPQPTEEYVRGDDLFDNSANSVGGPIGRAGGTWMAGETTSFRIANSECSLSAGDAITVSVVHTPSDSVVIEQRLTAS